MFGAFLRAAALFAAGMLFATALSAVLDPIISRLKDSLGANHQLVTGLEAVNEWFVFVILVSLLLGLIARALIERQASGGF